MSNVHRDAVRKVRSAAQCLRADAAESRDEVMRALLLGAITDLEKRADSIEEQVKPAIEEPKAFGSIVRAGIDEHSDRVLWQRGHKGSWWSEYGAFTAFWSWLHDPEVLRIGVGADEAEQISGEAYNRGAADVVRQAIEGLQRRYSDAITAERQDAYRIAMQIVEALA